MLHATLFESRCWCSRRNAFNFQNRSAGQDNFGKAKQFIKALSGQYAGKNVSNLKWTIFAF
jgi:hypothetical protein